MRPRPIRRVANDGVDGVDVRQRVLPASEVNLHSHVVVSRRLGAAHFLIDFLNKAPIAIRKGAFGFAFALAHGRFRARPFRFVSLAWHGCSYALSIEIGRAHV